MSTAVTQIKVGDEVVEVAPPTYPFSRFQEVFDFLEKNRTKDGTIVFKDTIGSYTQFTTVNGRRSPVPESHVDHVSTDSWMIHGGYNAAGFYQRVVIDVGGSYRIVHIDKGMPTIDEKWMPR